MAPGVYVHVPFCTVRCDYCDFATWTDRAHLVQTYVDACVVDVRRRVTTGELSAAAGSVFFGGGTPSLLLPAQLASILGEIPLDRDAEVTVECNPDSVDDAKLDGYAAGGVNRLSFGVQSMRPHVLQALGRTHDPDNVARAVAAARRCGFRRLNLDLIYGTPGESLDDWRATLDDALALGPDHVSAYALTVEPGTPLGRLVAAGSRPAPDDDDQADKYTVADEVLERSGLAWYEISNWARPGQECRHNELYWHGGEYVGIGCAAHGHTGGRRWWNVRTPERYVALVAAGTSTEAGSEVRDDGVCAEEDLALGLRTRAGVELPEAAQTVASDLVAAGLLERHGGRIVLTRRGRLLASEVTVRLLGTGVGTAGTR
ncbi:MAG: radical SAM family heme chaperone HemW [Actinobacteria bacterium]|nr:radical SAM family heme chaperone HemW [Actinomycetota bacterium]